MIYKRLHVTFVGIVATLVDSVVVAEFAGYWLRRLLYNDKFPPFNWARYQATVRRYGLDETEFSSLHACSQALFHKSDSSSRG